MLSKAKIIIAAVLVLGLASAAQAGGRDDADSSGGYAVTPNGSGVNPALHPEFFGQTENAYGYAAVRQQPLQNQPVQNQPVQKKKANTR
jgi:hypothetical protein